MIIKEYPTLTLHGFELRGCPIEDNPPDNLVNYFKNKPKLDNFNRKVSSSYYTDKLNDKYKTNFKQGEVILAAIQGGCQIQQQVYGKEAYFNISEEDLTKLDAIKVLNKYPKLGYNGFNTGEKEAFLEHLGDIEFLMAIFGRIPKQTIINKKLCSSVIKQAIQEKYTRYFSHGVVILAAALSGLKTRMCEDKKLAYFSISKTITNHNFIERTKLCL